MLRFDDEWVWDSWAFDDGDLFHLWFLRAPKALGDPTLRHARAKVGHATSRDLMTWERIPDRPVLEPDATRYATLAEDPRASETWRDSFVMADGDGWVMLLSARAREAEPRGGGTIATARSRDLLHWELTDDVVEPAGFGEVEVVQVREVDGHHVLVFTCNTTEQTDERLAVSGEFCTWSVVGDSPRGPWDLARAVPFTAEPRLFAAPLLRDRAGRWLLLGFRNREAFGDWTMEIGDPVPVRVEGGGLAAY